MCSSFLESVAVMEFQTAEAYSSRGLTNAVYNTNKQSHDDDDDNNNNNNNNNLSLLLVKCQTA
jgi:hypothetical protein